MFLPIAFHALLSDNVTSTTNTASFLMTGAAFVNAVFSITFYHSEP
jgi:hypothetical protein